MFTPTALTSLLSSPISPARSCARISTSTAWLSPWSGPQSMSKTRSGSGVLTTFAQVRRWMAMPRPRVTKPTTSSPGHGVAAARAPAEHVVDAVETQAARRRLASLPLGGGLVGRVRLRGRLLALDVRARPRRPTASCGRRSRPRRRGLRRSGISARSATSSMVVWSSSRRASSRSSSSRPSLHRLFAALLAEPLAHLAARAGGLQVAEARVHPVAARLRAACG